MRTTTLALALALALTACSDEQRPDVIPTPLAVDASAAAPTEDAGTTAADAADEMLIPIAVWVDDLIEHRTNESAPPDTVEDKRIRESEEPTLFDKYFE